MSQVLQFSVGDRVQVKFRSRWYTGTVADVDQDDDIQPYRVVTDRTLPDGTDHEWATVDRIRNIPARKPAGVAPPTRPATEADPTGKDQHQPGAKVDAGKILPALVLGEFARALEAVVRVGTKGARKYTPRGWLEVPNGQERYAEAAFRHQLEVWKGNRLDDGEGGTGELHRAQVIWNLLAELELELRNGTDK